jgi:(S)-sulfolactate dehydrogenase
LVYRVVYPKILLAGVLLFSLHHDKTIDRNRMPYKILITEFMDQAAVHALESEFEVEYLPQLVDRPDALLEKISTADALIVRNRTRVEGPVLAAAAKLKVIGRLGVGLDNIDQDTCRVRGVTVIPATGANAGAVAEYVIASAMLLRRGVYGNSQQLAAGDWPRAQLSQGREVAGARLGLIGFGSIGQYTARLARAIGMEVLAHDPALGGDDPAWAAHGVVPLALEALLKSADVISLHLPLTSQTRHLIGARELALLRSGSVLINTARGGIVDEAALVDALQSGRLAAAALDVFEEEPLSSANPFAGLRNVLLTPHIAGVTQESNQRVSALIAQRVGALLRSQGESNGHD